jgi:hypothetical protein
MNHRPPNNAGASPACKLLDRLASPLDGIANLTFLTLREAEHPEKVRFYMGMAEEQMRAIRQILLKAHTDRS